MRKAARVVVLFLLSLVSTAVLTTIAAILAAVSLAATALIVPGTGTPNANGISNYMENFRDYYMRTTPCVEGDCDAPYNPVTGEGLRGIDYPASFWPIPLPGWCPNLSCDTFDVSVTKGVQSLDSALVALRDLGYSGDVVIAGYSQGARVASIEKAKFVRGDWDDLLTQFDSVSFVFIGNPNRPNGGLLTRLGFLPHIPILNVTTGQPTPTGPPNFHTEDWAIRWEGIADWPTYILNPLAVVNSLLGFYYDHGTYLAFNGKSDPGETPAGYSLEEWQELTKNPQLYPDNVDIQPYGDTTYYTVTPKTLPLVRPLHLIPLIGKPIADLIEPFLRVLIEETGYARWLPFGAPVGTGIIPIFNPITLFLKLIPAVFVGINNFFANFGLTQAIPLTPPIPVPPAVSSLTVDPQDQDQVEDNPDDLAGARMMRAQDNGDGDQQPGEGDPQLLSAQTEGDLTEGTIEGTEGTVEGTEGTVEGTEGTIEGTEGTIEETGGTPEGAIEGTEGNEPEQPEGTEHEQVEELNHDPEESKDPEENRVDANGGSVSLNFSPHDNKPGANPTDGDGEGEEQPAPAAGPEPSAPGAGTADGSEDSGQAAA